MDNEIIHKGFNMLKISSAAMGCQLAEGVFLVDFLGRFVIG